MSGRVDHAANARAWLVGAEDRDVPPGPVATSFGVIAQAHATLALVEQQRIANLIALSGLNYALEEEMGELGNEAANRLMSRESTPVTPFSGPDEIVTWRVDVREALGL